MGITVVEVRLSDGHLIIVMEIPIDWKTAFALKRAQTPCKDMANYQVPVIVFIFIYMYSVLKTHNQVKCQLMHADVDGRHFGVCLNASNICFQQYDMVMRYEVKGWGALHAKSWYLTSSPPNAAYKRQRFMSALFQVMACHLRNGGHFVQRNWCNGINILVCIISYRCKQRWTLWDGRNVTVVTKMQITLKLINPGMIFIICPPITVALLCCIISVWEEQIWKSLRFHVLLYKSSYKRYNLIAL